MIRLTRVRSAAAIHANFRRDNKKQFEKELLFDQRRVVRGALEKHPFNSDRWKKAKDQLIAETGRKCAYCEAPTTQVAYGDVEHYRPKSVYWWLAYCYDNFLISCQLCNQKFKKAKFPIRNTKMRGPTIRHNTTDAFIESKAGTIAPDPLDQDQVGEFIELHQEERPLLLNPYFDDPTNFFAWHADENTKEVELIPLPTNPDAEAFCNAAIKYYGLNRKELKDYRWGEYEKYWTYRLVLTDTGLNAIIRERIRQMIEKMKTSKTPYAGMIRYFDSFPFDNLPSPPAS
ncbi:MAG: hypothetical protein ACE5JP_14470 [Candidatus Bipolaricaulia bacterium]